MNSKLKHCKKCENDNQPRRKMHKHIQSVWKKVTAGDLFENIS